MEDLEILGEEGGLENSSKQEWRACDKKQKIALDININKALGRLGSLVIHGAKIEKRLLGCFRFSTIKGCAGGRGGGLALSSQVKEC